MSIDLISQEIGKLQAEAASSRKQRALLFNKMDGISNQVCELTTIIKTQIEVSNVNITALSDIVKSQGKSISALHKAKNRLYIGLAAATGSAGAVSAAVTNWLKTNGIS